MIRTPTTEDAALRWHRAALADPSLPRHPDWPECGWYRQQWHRGGPWIPVMIWIEAETDEQGELIADERLRCVSFLEPADPYRVWPWLEPISETAYRSLVELRLRTQHLNPRQAFPPGPVRPGGRR